MKTCRECGAELLSASDRFCNRCGKPVQANQAGEQGRGDKFCKNCGKELQKEWKTCPFCATLVKHDTGAQHSSTNTRKSTKQVGSNKSSCDVCEHWNARSKQCKEGAGFRVNWGNCPLGYSSVMPSKGSRRNSRQTQGKKASSGKNAGSDSGYLDVVHCMGCSYVNGNQCTYWNLPISKIPNCDKRGGSAGKMPTANASKGANKNTKKCPVCGSTNVAQEQKKNYPVVLPVLGLVGIATTIAATIAANIIQSNKMHNVCQTCGHSWD